MGASMAGEPTPHVLIHIAPHGANAVPLGIGGLLPFFEVGLPFVFFANFVHIGEHLLIKTVDHNTVFQFKSEYIASCFGKIL